MRAGELRHFMQIVVDTVVTAIDGTKSKGRTVIGTAWVHIIPIDLREFGIVPTVSARPSHKLTMRFAPFLPDSFTFVSAKDGKEYVVKSLEPARINVDERDKTFEILVVEDV